MATSEPGNYIIGVDLGGTNVSVGVLSEDGSRTVSFQSEPTESERGAESIVDRIADGIERGIANAMSELGIQRDRFLGVGIGAPGPLDRERGLVVVAPNLGWRNFPLRDAITERVGLPAALDNDANCATYGEWWLGAARGGRNVVGMTIGTGIGGGLILDGALYHGSSDVAGEVGHMSINSSGRHCKCGNYGCIEAYASGPAIAERAREALMSEDHSMLPDLVNGNLELITAETVYDASERGDEIARHVVRETAQYLGAAVANLLNIFNPDVVVIAGGVTRAGEALFEPLRAEVRRRAFKPAVDVCRIVPGALAGRQGVVGAVATFKMQMLGGV
jgi:glucokinase